MLTIDTVGRDIIEKILPLTLEEYALIPKWYTQVFGEAKVSDHPTHSTGTDFVACIEAVMPEDERSVMHDAPMGDIKASYKWIVKNREIDAYVPIEENALEDLMAGNIETFASAISKPLATAFHEKIEQFHWDLFNYGAFAAGHWQFENDVSGGAPGVDSIEDSSGLFIYDGQPWFSASHPMSGATGTLSNFNAASALTVANLKAAITAYNFTNARDNANNKIRRKANILMVSENLQWTAEEILNSANIPYEISNTANVVAKNITTLLINPWITDADAWFVGSSDFTGLTSIYHPNYPPQGEFAIPYKLSFEKLDGKSVLRAKARLGAGITNWRGWDAYNLATS